MQIPRASRTTCACDNDWCGICYPPISDKQYDELASSLEKALPGSFTQRSAPKEHVLDAEEKEILRGLYKGMAMMGILAAGKYTPDDIARAGTESWGAKSKICRAARSLADALVDDEY